MGHVAFKLSHSSIQHGSNVGIQVRSLGSPWVGTRTGVLGKCCHWQAQALTENYFWVGLYCGPIEANSNFGLWSNCGVEFQDWVASSSIIGFDRPTQETQQPYQAHASWYFNTYGNGIMCTPCNF